MCSVAHHLAVKFLPLSRELFVISYPKTQTASVRIITVQRNLCFKVPLAHGLIIYLVLPFQVKYSFQASVSPNPRNSHLMSYLFDFGYTNQPMKLSLVAMLSNHVCSSPMPFPKPDRS
jgi:hypothetical protein